MNFQRRRYDKNFSMMKMTAIALAIFSFSANIESARAQNLFFTDFETCLQQNDYRCVVRSGYKEFSTLPWTGGLILSTKNDRRNFDVGTTLALTGETDLAAGIFHEQVDFFNRAKLGGSIIARLTFDNKFDDLEDFLASISSPSLFALSFKQAAVGLRKVSHKSRLKAQRIFAQRLKSLIDRNGLETFTNIETFKHDKKFNNKRLPIVLLPKFVFSGENLPWAMQTLSKIENPKIRNHLGKKLGPVTSFYLKQFKASKGQETFDKAVEAQKKRDLEIIKTEEQNPQKYKEPSKYADKSISKISFSYDKNKFVSQDSSHTSTRLIATMHDSIFGEKHLISEASSLILEKLYDSVSVQSCRVAALLSLSKAHAKRGDLERALTLVDKVLALDPPHRGKDRPECNYAGRVFAMVLKTLLSTETLLPQLFKEVSEIHKNQGYSHYLSAFNASEYSKPFAGLEDVTTHERRKDIISQILTLKNQITSHSPGRHENTMLIYMMKVRDSKLWTYIASEGLKRSTSLSSAKFEISKQQLLSMMATNRQIEKYWAELNQAD